MLFTVQLHVQWIAIGNNETHIYIIYVKNVIFYEYNDKKVIKILSLYKSL